MTEIDYGRLDAIEAALGGRAAIDAAYRAGTPRGLLSLLQAAESAGFDPGAPVFPGGSAPTLAEIAAAMPFPVDTPEAHGAVGNDTHDDASAIASAISSVVTQAQASGCNYGEVWFDPTKVYAAPGATIKGGSTQGNAQIPLPYITTGEAVAVRLKGVQATQGFYFTGTRRPGVVIHSTLTGAAFDATNGPPSIIGAPAPEKIGVGVFSRLFLIVDGVNLVGPQDPALHGFDLRGLTNARVVDATCQAPVTGLVNAGGGSFSAGLAMPVNNNSDYAEVGSFACVGWYCGFTPGEHTNARRIRVIQCRVGLGISTPSGYTYSHSARVEYLSTEQCRSHIYVDPILSANQSCSLDIGLWDIEDNDATGFATLYHLYDPSNVMNGHANIWRDDTMGFGGPPITVGAGGRNFTARYLPQSPGHVAAPSVPATTVALQNPFWRDAAVNITGGTATVIAVDGVATGLTSGTVVVPSGKSITLTYSAAPSWNWVLL